MANSTEKYALVTGASSGIGWHVSKKLAIKGYSLVAVSNQPEELLALKTELEENYSIKVLTIDCDLAKSDAAESVFDFCKQRDLFIEVLVNNAGFLIYSDVINVELNRTKNILQLHMNTPVMLCRLFGEIMAKKQRGYILNVSSISSVMPYPTISLYGPTKTFLRQFTKALRIEMKSHNVAVSCLLPGATATALYDKDKVNIPLATKLGVMQQPEYVAKVGLARLFRKKGESVPGLLNKLIMLFTPFFPTFIIGFIYRKFYLKRVENKKT